MKMAAELRRIYNLLSRDVSHNYGMATLGKLTADAECAEQRAIAASPHTPEEAGTDG